MKIVWICTQGDWLCRRRHLADRSFMRTDRNPGSMLHLLTITGRKMVQRIYGFSKELVRCAIIPFAVVFFLPVMRRKVR